MAKDSESDIWLVQGQELFKIGKNSTILKDPYLFPVNHLAGAFDLCADRDNTLWVTRWDGNENRIFKKSIIGPWTDVNPPESSYSQPVKFLRSDSKGTIWIAYSEYPKDILAYFDTDRWKEIQIPLDEIVINDVETCNNGLIIGTPKGIYATGIVATSSK
jgi:hypothetical protein